MILSQLTLPIITKGYYLVPPLYRQRSWRSPAGIMQLVNGKWNWSPVSGSEFSALSLCANFVSCWKLGLLQWHPHTPDYQKMAYSKVPTAWMDLQRPSWPSLTCSACLLAVSPLTPSCGHGSPGSPCVLTPLCPAHWLNGTSSVQPLGPPGRINGLVLCSPSTWLRWWPQHPSCRVLQFICLHSPFLPRLKFLEAENESYLSLYSTVSSTVSVDGTLKKMF
jgi:hypothetical protein